MVHVRRRNAEFRARNVAQRGEVDLPKSVFDKLLLGCFFRDFAAYDKFLLADRPFQ